MLEEQNKSQSPVALSTRADSAHFDTTKRSRNIVPATIEIDLGITPVAYRYESWSEMADGWVESLRSSVETMSALDPEQIQNITPLVPLSEVEAVVERMVLSQEAVMPHDHTDATGDTSLHPSSRVR